METTATTKTVKLVYCMGQPWGKEVQGTVVRETKTLVFVQYHNDYQKRTDEGCFNKLTGKRVRCDIYSARDWSMVL